MKGQIIKKLIILISVTAINLITAGQALAEEGSITIGVFEDTYAEEGYPDTQTWNQRNFFVGYETVAGKLRTRAYLKYDLTPLSQNDIRVGDLINANLKLWQYVSYGGDRQVEIYEPNYNWSQYYLTWNNQPASSLFATTIFSDEIGWQEADITDLVKKQLLYGNYGVAVRNQNEYIPGGVYWSNVCLIAPNPPICQSYQTPRVEITYNLNEPPTKPVLLAPANNYATIGKAMNFSWSTSTDPTGDAISYRIEISTDITFNEIVISSDWQSVTEYNLTFDNDGVFFWRVEAKDDRTTRTGVSISSAQSFEIDCTPPSVPIIEPEPPYTFGSTNSIFWNFDTTSEIHQVQFEVEVSTNYDFTNIIMTASTTTLGYTFTDLSEQKYYYRVRAIDILENKSSWSEITDSFQDYSIPLISEIILSEKYISPLESHGVKDILKINANIVDSTLHSWNLIIEDENREIIFSATGSTSTISINWGENASSSPELFQDGFYFVYITAQDNVGLWAKSTVLAFVVDNTTPLKPIITSPERDFLTNNKSVNISAFIEPFIDNKILINSTMAASTTASSFSRDFIIPIEGQNSILVISTDFAGNTSSGEISFFSDWTAPNLYNLELIPDITRNSIDIKFTSSDYSSAYIYNLGGLHSIIYYPNNKDTVVRDWSNDSIYSFYIVLKDSAGNLSSPSKTISYTTPKAAVLGIGDFNENNYTSPVLTSNSECKYRYNIDKNQLTRLRCAFPSPYIDQVFHKSSDKQNFLIETWGGYNINVQIEIALVNCKKKNILNPLTWYTCSEQIVKQRIITVKNGGDLLGYIGNIEKHPASRTTINEGSFGARFLSQSDYSNKNLTLIAKVITSQKIAPSCWIDIYEKSQPSNTKTIPIYTFSPSGNGKYFRFPFNKIVSVTQWHGYTAYDSPHTGIDFGVYREPIYAMADGYVSAVGWDNYYGDCYSGGNYIKIVHDNGMSTFFAHLENYNRSDGRAWTVGERVRKGDLIGLTGN